MTMFWILSQEICLKWNIFRSPHVFWCNVNQLFSAIVSVRKNNAIITLLAIIKFGVYVHCNLEFSAPQLPPFSAYSIILKLNFNVIKFNIPCVARSNYSTNVSNCNFSYLKQKMMEKNGNKKPHCVFDFVQQKKWTNCISTVCKLNWKWD